MSANRKRLALVILAVIVLGQCFDIFLQREDWPFSNYPMYAKLIRRRETSLFRLYGRVVIGQEQKVIPIVDDNTYMYVVPVNELRMKNILEFAWTRGGVPATQQVLRDYMAMYEERRLLGRHGTPEPGPRMLEAICMKLTWKLDGKKMSETPTMEEITSASAFPGVPPTTEGAR